MDIDTEWVSRSNGSLGYEANDTPLREQVEARRVLLRVTLDEPHLAVLEIARDRSFIYPLSNCCGSPMIYRHRALCGECEGAPFVGENGRTVQDPQRKYWRFTMIDHAQAGESSTEESLLKIKFVLDRWNVPEAQLELAATALWDRIVELNIESAAATPLHLQEDTARPFGRLLALSFRELAA